jgi:hypothetical protein
MTTITMRYEKGGSQSLLCRALAQGWDLFAKSLHWIHGDAGEVNKAGRPLELDSRSLGKAELLPGSARRTGHVCGVLPVV